MLIVNAVRMRLMVEVKVKDAGNRIIYIGLDLFKAC